MTRTAGGGSRIFIYCDFLLELRLHGSLLKCAAEIKYRFYIFREKFLVLRGNSTWNIPIAVAILAIMVTAALHCIHIVKEKIKCKMY